MQDGDLRVSLASISAQSYMYEELPEVEVIGNLRDCPWGCGTRLCKTEMDVHEQNCDLRMVECPRCHQKDTKSRIDNGWHQCGSSSNNEGSNTGGGGGGHSGGGVGHVGGGGNFGGGGTSQSGESDKLSGPAGSKKSNVSKSKLKEGIRKFGYNVDYTQAKFHCLRGWKTVWNYAGIGEYDGTIPAKDFGPVLLKYGFKVIAEGNGESRPSGYTPQIGDTRVWDTYPGQKAGPYGHIDWYDGKNWISDYTQPGNGFWAPGKNYRKHNTSYKIYR